nr:YcnI family protein [Nakamurella flavida]
MFAGAGVAAAHVSVAASSTEAGSYSLLTFRVPNESATAGTVAVKVEIPADHPLASVSYEAVPGWTTTVQKDTLPSPVVQGDLTLTEAVSSVTWTADAGTSIEPGQFARFALSVGPLPDIDALTFPADQTYSDGSVVRWADPENADGSEAEHPAPSFTITPAATGADADHHGGATGSAPATGTTEVPAVTDTATTAAATADDTDSPARTLGIVGIVVAAVALLTAAIGLRRPHLKKDPS